MRILLTLIFLLSSSCAEEVAMKAGARNRKNDTLVEKNSGTANNMPNHANASDASKPNNPFSNSNEIANASPGYNNGFDSDGSGPVKPPITENEITPGTGSPNRSRIMVGFNYEDTPNYDHDYNDGVLCIEGQYEIDFTNGTALSLVDQEATLVFRDGGYNVNSIEVKKYRGSASNATHVETVYNFQGFQNRPTKIVRGSYRFKAGDYISISYNRNKENFAAIPLALGGNSKLIKIEVDKCRTSGN